MEAGLVCGMCADVLLGVAFFAGLGVFTLGHALYLAALYSLERFSPRELWLFVPVAAVSVFVVTGTPWITVEDPVMQILVAAYAVIISVMLSKAVSNLIHRPGLARWLIALGSVLFFFSDLILAIDMFGQASRLTWVLCSYSYWPGQNLLAHALYHVGRQYSENEVSL